MNNLILFDSKEALITDPYQIIDNLDISQCTREDYKYRIRYFLEFIAMNGFGRNTYLLFKRELENRVDIGIAAKNKYLSASKSYLKEIYRQGLIPNDITAGIKLFSQSKKHKVFGHTREEMKKMIEALRLYNLRDKSILYLLIYQGMRQIEVVRLEVSDIDIPGKTILIHGKGKDDKEIVNLHSETTKVLSEYLKKINRKSGKLFNLTTRTIRNIHSKLAKKLGIKKSAHGTRHYFTTQLLKAFDGDVFATQKFTRHASSDMLNVYNDELTLEKYLPAYEDAFSNIAVNNETEMKESRKND